jgi:hypothetical protein
MQFPARWEFAGNFADSGGSSVDYGPIFASGNHKLLAEFPIQQSREFFDVEQGNFAPVTDEFCREVEKRTSPKRSDSLITESDRVRIASGIR